MDSGYNAYPFSYSSSSDSRHQEIEGIEKNVASEMLSAVPSKRISLKEKVSEGMLIFLYWT